MATGRANERTRRLLADATRVAIVDMDNVAAEVRRLGALWGEQELLDPTPAAETLRALPAEVHRVEPKLALLRVRQNVIAAELLRLTREP